MYNKSVKVFIPFQSVTKSISRPIAPAPGAHGGGTAIKPVAAHQISGLAPAALKKGTCNLKKIVIRHNKKTCLFRVMGPKILGSIGTALIFFYFLFFFICRNTCREK